MYNFVAAGTQQHIFNLATHCQIVLQSDCGAALGSGWLSTAHNLAQAPILAVLVALMCVSVDLSHSLLYIVCLHP